MDCIFCKIANGEIPTDKLYEDDKFGAILDAAPATKGHTLIIPKKHVVSAADLGKDDKELAAHIFCDVVPKLAKELGLSKGFRVVTNVGEEGGQTVMHLHFHLLGGRSMQWPPG